MEKKRTGRVGRRERRDSRICNALSGGKASFCTLAAAMRNGSPAYRDFAPLNAPEHSKLLGNKLQSPKLVYYQSLSPSRQQNASKRH
jgi:hypothetical protein